MKSSLLASVFTLKPQAMPTRTVFIPEPYYDRKEFQNRLVELIQGREIDISYISAAFDGGESLRVTSGGQSFLIDLLSSDGQTGEELDKVFTKIVEAKPSAINLYDQTFKTDARGAEVLTQIQQILPEARRKLAQALSSASN